MGAHSLHNEANDNGKRLIDICSRHQLYIGGTKFPHKAIHKYTWSPRGRPQVKTQIDQICISRKFLNTLLDVRTKRSADISSDHELLLGSIRLKFAKVRRKKRPRKINVQRLNDPSTANLFNERLCERLPTGDANHSWDSVESALVEVAQSSLGYTNQERKPWISESTWAKIEEKRACKIRLDSLHVQHPSFQQTSNEHKNLAKAVKRLARADKRGYFENLADRAQTAEQNGDIRSVFKIINKLSGKGFNVDPPIRAADG